MTRKQDPRQVARNNILSLQKLDESDRAFAERVGISPASLSNMKNQGQGAGLETVVNVARATGYSVDSLLGMEGGAAAPNKVEVMLADLAAAVEEARAKLREREEGSE